MRDKRKRGRGFSLIETLIVLLILSFIMAITSQFYFAGLAQNNLATGYSEAQSDLSTALHRVLRTLRHGYALTHTSVKDAFPPGSMTDYAQVIVPIPELDTDGTHKEIRIYVSNGTLYAQRSDETGMGTLMIAGLQNYGAEFRYFNNTGGVLTEVAAQPELATEVQVTLTPVRNGVTTSATARVALRNKILSP